MNIVIPMAGAGSRFAEAGYEDPKPFIKVNGKPMIELVLENLGLDGKYYFIVQADHCVKYNLHERLREVKPDCEVIEIDHMTEGAAETVMLAAGMIDNDTPLFTANSDQWVKWGSQDFINRVMQSDADGAIPCFKYDKPSASYAKIENKVITEVAEKKVISNDATVGFYWWRRGSDFVKYAHQMFEKNIRTNNEFYVCPVYNEAIADGKKIIPYHVEEMWGLGTPDELDKYLRNKFKSKYS